MSLIRQTRSFYAIITFLHIAYADNKTRFLLFFFCASIEELDVWREEEKQKGIHRDVLESPAA